MPNSLENIPSIGSEWTGELGMHYGKYFNSLIPSDYPGYEMVKYFIPRGASVLEIGCSHGNFTEQLSEHVGDEGWVVGTDISSDALGQAYKKLSGKNNVSLFQVNNARTVSETRAEQGELSPNEVDKRLPLKFFLGDEVFDRAVMTFIDPVLDISQLNEVIRGVYTALKPGGSVIFFRLNPDVIMSASSSYRYYGERYPVDVNKKGRIEDGDLFRHELTSKDGDKITLLDHYYSTHYMRNMLFDAGFDTRNFNVYSLTRSMNNGVGEVINNALNTIKVLVPDAEFIDEWGEDSGNSLYQVIVAHKPHITRPLRLPKNLEF